MRTRTLAVLAAVVAIAAGLTLLATTIGNKPLPESRQAGTPGVPGANTTGVAEIAAKVTSPGTRSDAVPAPSDPVPDGEPLSPLTNAPKKTLAFVNQQSFSGVSEFSAEFRPYGYGPGGQSRSLVAHIIKAVPAKGGAAGSALEGLNVLLDVSQLDKDRMIKVGGTYSGTVVLAGSGGALALRLVDVR